MVESTDSESAEELTRSIQFGLNSSDEAPNKDKVQFEQGQVRILHGQQAGYENRTTDSVLPNKERTAQSLHSGLTLIKYLIVEHSS